MRIFLTGATGYIGTALADALEAAGHTVAPLARSVDADQDLRHRGLTPFRGDLRNPDSLTAPVIACDGVIHAGTTNDGRVDTDAVAKMLAALRGSGKPFIYTSGVWVYGNTGDRVADEEYPLNPIPLVAWRPAAERIVLDAAVRSIVIRPAIVYGRAAGILGDFVQSAHQRDAARYVGDGANRWPLVHVEDLADLYVRALEHAPAATVLNAADGPSLRVRALAEAASFGADAGGNTEAWPLEQARVTLGAYADALVLDQQVSSQKARSLLGWTPHAASPIEELRFGSYALPRVSP
jgi:nucleoside-diphosphate-sugar epimerase